MFSMDPICMHNGVNRVINVLTDYWIFIINFPVRSKEQLQQWIHSFQYKFIQGRVYDI